MTQNRVQTLYAYARIAGVVIMVIAGVAVLYARLVLVEVKLDILDKKVDRIVQRMENGHAPRRAGHDTGSPDTAATVQRPVW